MTSETMTEKTKYRGYEIELRREWSNWCARVHPMRAELPILAQSALSTLSRRKDQALAAAKRSVDAALIGLDQKVA